jgi:hypothetical protein
MVDNLALYGTGASGQNLGVYSTVTPNNLGATPSARAVKQSQTSARRKRAQSAVKAEIRPFNCDDFKAKEVVDRGGDDQNQEGMEE